LLPWDWADPWRGSTLMKGKREQVLQWMQEKIMDEYDFIGVTERMDESLAVMVLLWNLEPSDVVVLSAKKAGGYDDAGSTGQCSKIVRPQPPSPVLRHYWSNEHPLDNADFLLWDAVNLSLDRTILRLGVERVQKVIRDIQSLGRLAENHCQAKAHFPCSDTGQPQLKLAEQSCYVQDAGCGHKCVDNVMEDYKLGKLALPTSPS
jgi:hypothetical protein